MEAKGSRAGRNSLVGLFGCEVKFQAGGRLKKKGGKERDRECIWRHKTENFPNLRKPLGESERGEEKVGLKLNIQKTKIMASSLITSWQIYGETVETVADFIFGGSKITADGDCSHEIKRHFLAGKL